MTTNSSSESTDRLDPDREPGLARKAASFAAAAARHLADGAAHVPDPVYETRLATCRACDRFDPDRAACRACGCRLELKARWRSAACPLGRWSESRGNEDDARPPPRFAEANLTRAHRRQRPHGLRLPSP